MLVARLDFLIPMNFFLSQEWQLMFGVDSKIAIGRVVELNRQWVIEVVNNLEHRLTDVLHDFKGIYAEDEHFLPRIQAEDILGDFDENGDAVDVNADIIKMIKDRNIDGENMQYILEKVGMDYQMYKQLNVENYEKGGVWSEEKVNGYTNIQTYRLCLVLDNEGEIIPNPMQRFFELCAEDEFEITDTNLINWNEVIERYSSTNWKHIVNNIRHA